MWGGGPTIARPLPHHLDDAPEARHRMRLTEALRLQPGMSVAFTGAGGKTSALAVLVAESRGRRPLVVTTTTRLGIDQRSLADSHRIVRSPAQANEVAFDPEVPLLVTGPEDADQGKLHGLDPLTLQAIAGRARSDGAILAIEADGSRRRQLKAPAEHEPVVPAWVDVVVPVAGLGAIGERLDEAVAHRPERVAAILGVPIGETIEIGHIARLLESPQAGLKGIPASAEVRCLVNGSGAELDAARRIAGLVLGSSRIRCVVGADLVAPDPVRAVFGRVAGVILAAGAGSRLGQVKPVAEWQGRPLVGYVLEAARRAGLSPLVLVTGFEAEEVRRAVAGEDVVVVHNDGWPQGQSTSVRLGLAAAENDSEAVVFLLADMPKVSSTTIKRMADLHARSLPTIVAPVAGGRRGNPVLFDRSAFDDLRSLQGDQGGRSLLDHHPWLSVEADPEEFFQVERPEDLARLRGAV